MSQSIFEELIEILISAPFLKLHLNVSLTLTL